MAKGSNAQILCTLERALDRATKKDRSYFLSFLVGSCLPQLIFLLLASAMLDNYCSFFSINALGVGLSSVIELKVRSNNYNPCEWSLSRELPNGSNSDNALRMELFEEL